MWKGPELYRERVQMKRYEVTSNYGTSVMVTEQDAINAMWLLGTYHDIKISPEAVRAGLRKNGFYEIFPLSVVTCG